jgi:hypothetical protein
MIEDAWFHCGAALGGAVVALLISYAVGRWVRR